MNKTMLLSLFKSADCSRLSLLGRFFRLTPAVGAANQL